MSAGGVDFQITEDTRWIDDRGRRWRVWALFAPNIVVGCLVDCSRFGREWTEAEVRAAQEARRHG